MPATSHVEAGTPSLRHLLRQGGGAKEIADYLDGLSPGARVAEVLGITGKGVGRLYDAVADAPSLSLEEIVPANATGTIVFEGRNSLPLFSRFQKRFVRTEGGVVLGYNHQSMAFLTGPGYFLVKPASGGEGEHDGELYFDYTQAPPAEPEGWPAYKPNDRGLSRSVYMNMIDYCRRVARGVLVGKAYKLGVDQNAYFSLSREA